MSNQPTGTMIHQLQRCGELCRAVLRRNGEAALAGQKSETDNRLEGDGQELRQQGAPKAMNPTPKTTVVIHLVPASGNWAAPPERRLARFLKSALRAYGWRCIACRPALPADARPANNIQEGRHE